MEPLRKDAPDVTYEKYCNILVVDSLINGWTLHQDNAFADALRDKTLRDLLKPDFRFVLVSFDIDIGFAVVASVFGFNQLFYKTTD